MTFAASAAVSVPPLQWAARTAFSALLTRGRYAIERYTPTTSAEAKMIAIANAFDALAKPHQAVTGLPLESILNVHAARLAPGCKTPMTLTELLAAGTEAFIGAPYQDSGYPALFPVLEGSSEGLFFVDTPLRDLPKLGGPAAYQPRLRAALAILAENDRPLEHLQVRCLAPVLAGSETALRDTYFLITLPQDKIGILVSDRMDAPVHMLRNPPRLTQRWNEPLGHRKKDYFTFNPAEMKAWKTSFQLGLNKLLPATHAPQPIATQKVLNTIMPLEEIDAEIIASLRNNEFPSIKSFCLTPQRRAFWQEISDQLKRKKCGTLHQRTLVLIHAKVHEFSAVEGRAPGEADGDVPGWEGINWAGLDRLVRTYGTTYRTTLAKLAESPKI